MKAAVIGSGAVGSFIAIELAKTGCEVTRFGAVAHPGEASVVAGAMLGLYGEVTRDTFRTQFARDRFALDRLARDRWHELIEEFSEKEGADLVVANSTLIVHNAIGSGAVDDANWATITQALRDDKAPFEHLDHDQVKPFGLAPAALERPLEAVHVQDEKAIDPVVLAELLTGWFARLGGTDSPELIRRLGIKDGCIRSVETYSGETHEFDVVVIAAGAFSAELIASIPELADVPPLFSGAGVSLVAEQAPQSIQRLVIRTPNRAFACGLHAIPRGPGRWYLGATNHLVAAPVEHPLFEDLRFVLDCAQGQIHRGFSDSRVSAVYTGNRPVSADGAPIIGATRISGLLLATGTYREGVHLSPLIGEYIAALVTGDETRDQFASFNPHRDPIVREREATIADTVEQAIATGDEYKWTVPHGITDALRHAWTSHFGAMLDGLPSEVVPPPEVLTVLHTQPKLRRRLMTYYQAVSERR